MNMPTTEETHPNYQATGSIHCWGSARSPECKHLLQEKRNEESGNDIESFQKEEEEEDMAEMCCLAEWHRSLRKEYMSGEMKREIFCILFLPQKYSHRLAGCFVDVMVPFIIMFLLLLIFLKSNYLKSPCDYLALYGPFAPAMILFLLQVYRRPIVFCFPDEWVATYQTHRDFLAKLATQQECQSATMSLLDFAISLYLFSVIAWCFHQVHVSPPTDL
jgi:hypothetical protein